MGIDGPLARRDLIAARLAEGHTVSAAALAAEFLVSDDAIRRDLRALAASGVCRRVYGGALPLQPGATPITARLTEDRARKAALGRAAAATVEAGEFLFLDNGSTNLTIVEALSDALDLAIATNAIDIAAALVRRRNLLTFLIGGAVDPVIGGCVDATAVEAIARLNLDRCFLGACALSAEGGVSAHEATDAAFKRALLPAGRRTIVLATNGKLEARAPHRVCPVSAVDLIVVEHDAPEAALGALARAGASLLRADPPA